MGKSISVTKLHNQDLKDVGIKSSTLKKVKSRGDLYTKHNIKLGAKSKADKKSALYFDRRNSQFARNKYFPGNRRKSKLSSNFNSKKLEVNIFSWQSYTCNLRDLPKITKYCRSV